MNKSVDEFGACMVASQARQITGRPHGAPGERTRMMTISVLTLSIEAVTAAVCALVVIVSGARSGRWATIPQTAKYFDRHMNDPAARGGPS